MGEGESVTENDRNAVVARGGYTDVVRVGANLLESDSATFLE